jgi:hypothetical protein
MIVGQPTQKKGMVVLELHDTRLISLPCSLTLPQL